MRWMELITTLMLDFFLQLATFEMLAQTEEVTKHYSNTENVRCSSLF